MSASPERGTKLAALGAAVVTDLIDAVTEYCDTSYLKRVLFDQ